MEHGAWLRVQVCVVRHLSASLGVDSSSHSLSASHVPELRDRTITLILSLEVRKVEAKPPAQGHPGNKCRIRIQMQMFGLQIPDSQQAKTSMLTMILPADQALCCLHSSPMLRF